MPIAPPDTPTERFATLVAWLGRAVAARVAKGLAGPLIILIWQRVNLINQRFARLAARIRRGRPAPQTPAAPRSGAGRPPGRPNTLPQGFGWLVRLVPEAAAFASQLQFLLADPGMAALIAAAPVPMGRVLRPLCRMLGVAPPPILSVPVKPRLPRTKTPPPAPEPPPPRPPLQMPSWWVEPPRRTRWSFGRTRSPPRSA